MNGLPAGNTTPDSKSHLGQVEKCKRCSSRTQQYFGSELAIHFAGLKGLDKPIVWVFPKVLVCLSCGLAEFTLPDRELRVLRDGTVADGAMVWPRAA